MYRLPVDELPDCERNGLARTVTSWPVGQLAPGGGDTPTRVSLRHIGTPTISSVPPSARPFPPARTDSLEVRELDLDLDLAHIS
jgi:hypothetical protein